MPGAGPKGLVLDASGRRAYISLMDDHRLVAVDLPSGRISWTLDVGGSPERMAIGHEP